MAINLYQPTIKLCTIPNDDFIKYKAHWIATLTNGGQIFQDDERPGEEIPSAWIRLQMWLNHAKAENRKISIKGLHLRFRSNILYPLPTDANGYFFCHKLVQFVIGKPLNFFVVGTVEDNVIKRSTIKVPELIKVAEDIKPLEKYEDFVIMRS